MIECVGDRLVCKSQDVTTAPRPFSLANITWLTLDHSVRTAFVLLTDSQGFLSWPWSAARVGLDYIVAEGRGE